MNRLKLVKGIGNYRWDEDGNRYLDFTSGGIFSAIFGANSSYIRDAIKQTTSVCCYEAHYDSPESLRLKDMLKDLTGYESVCLFTTGTDATEAFWRACRVYTGKPGIWGGLVNPDEVGQTDPWPHPDAMHGMTLGALVMAGKMRLPHPGMFAELGGLEGKPQEATGCAIFEPYHAPSAQFHKEDPTMNRMRERIKEFKDIYFCCDEVQGGMGRTGKLFAHQWYSPEIRPDFVTLGKALGGGLPVSALLGPKNVLEDEKLLESAHLHTTHSGNPVMCAAAIAVIERIVDEGWVDKVYQKGIVLDELLKDCGLRVHSGKGLLAGLETDGPLMTMQIVEKCREKGLLVVDTGRKWVKLGPAYTITEDDLITGTRILKEAIQEVKDGIAAACGEEGKEPDGSGQDVSEVGVQGGGSGGEISGSKDDGPEGTPVRTD